jgi:hypothetical protein
MLGEQELGFARSAAQKIHTRDWKTLGGAGVARAVHTRQLGKVLPRALVGVLAGDEDLGVTYQV